MVRHTGTRERGSAYLSIVVGNKEIQRRPIKDAIILGRSLDCDVWFEDGVLSRHHCRLEPALEGDGWVVTDLESRNGTFVNAKRIKERTPLNHKDIVTIGRAHLTFHAHGYTPPRPADPTAALLMPARTKSAMDRTPTPHHSTRPLPTPKVSPADSTMTSLPSPGETLSGDRTVAFSRPPAKPMVKREEEK